MGIEQRVEEKIVLHAEAVTVVIDPIRLTPLILHHQTATVAVAVGSLKELGPVGLNPTLQFFTHLLKFEP